ncbi:hypothetical protein Dpo_1c07410 [Desulfotignum phosphitoxidans DSM 13687]|uniref:Uncharacterized protein n=1 Tax=Desulfotignum phosphitoxidans DSM 13687 TaxID=1286635 RepID=S0G3V2_9BACT|nr:hypothetical protein Dpo_1c07410 [Desulfotignum phosphitoxidans DSM 13687]
MYIRVVDSFTDCIVQLTCRDFHIRFIIAILLIDRGVRT